jgi:hypothetical protein
MSTWMASRSNRVKRGKAAIVPRMAVCALTVLALFGIRARAAQANPEELQYFRYLLMTIAGADYSSDAIAKMEGSLVYHFGVDAREAALIHAAGESMRRVLADIRHASATAVAPDPNARREQAIADLTNRILETLRPEIAARMRMPGQITANALAAARANPAAIPTGISIDNLTDFQSCLSTGWNATHTVNYGNVCQLTRGLYMVPCSVGSAGCGAGDISGPLIIGRSGTRSSPLWVLGTAVSGVADTILQRSATSLKSIMTVGKGITYVDIDNLTFDGNRYAGCSSISVCGPRVGLGLNCLPATDNSIADLNAGAGGVVTIQYVDFINAPWIALILGGTASTLSYSNLGLGFRSETAAETATRATGVFLMGQSSGVYYSNIYYAGGSAINLYQGTGQYVYGNTLIEDQYELSYAGCQYSGCPPGGGQLFIDPATTGATVAANVIDGNYWRTLATPPPINGCPVAPNQTSLGIEAYGNGHRFLNNSIMRNMSSGITLGGSSPTNNITISGLNSFDANDTPRYIQDNHWGGIRFLGPKTCGNICSYTSSGVTLSHLRVVRNNAYGIYLESVSGTGFWESKSPSRHRNDVCMYGNVTGDVCSFSASHPKCSPRDRGFASGNRSIHNVAKAARCPPGY